MADKEQSPYERRAYAYIERGYSVIPIAPGTKRPGQWTQEQGWRGMHDWERFSTRLPTEIELEHWYRWPQAGIGLLTGKLSRIVALDRDYDTGGTDALDQMIPYTPVKKRGAKGYTAFFRYNGEKSCSFNINKLRVLDVLSDGRQTLMPGTIHPDGHTYVYLTEDCLEDFDPDQLPALPDDFLDRVAAILAPHQTDDDKKYQKKTIALSDSADPIDTGLSIEGQYFRDLNEQALLRLDEWVPKLIPKARKERDGYRCIATWRGVKNANVGIHPKGIFDFGGNYSMTAITLVMYANSVNFNKAVDALRECIPMTEAEPLTMTVNGAIALGRADQPAAANESAKPKPVAPAVLPWQLPKNTKPKTVLLPPSTSVDPAPALPAFLSNPPGILGDIARWITATAPKSQPELALAAAIALCSVIMGRTYRSQYGNWTSLYLVMVAKSTEGKEHPQACVEKVLSSAGLTNLIGGSGYTSSGAVYSALLKEPCHVATIDEMGKLLKVSRAKGQSHTEAALDKLVEAFGRQDGVLRPPTYSTMTLSKTQSVSVAERVVHNPAITLLGATTPGTFFENLTDDLVMDGFLGRCLVVQSRQPRQLTRFVDRTDPPQKIIEWCTAVHVGNAADGNLAGMLPADMPAKVIELPLDESCRPLMDAFESRLNDAKEACEGEGLDVLLGRTLEKAMKISMIVCKAENPDNKTVMPNHLEWAINFVHHYDSALVRAVRTERVASQTDANVKRAIEYIRNATKYTTDTKYAPALMTGAMPHSKLLKLMKMSARDFKEVMDTAVESGAVLKSPGSEFGLAGINDVYRVGELDE